MRTAEKQVLEAALTYVAKGLPVFPVHKPTEKGCSCGRASCSSVGKHPAIPGEPQGGLHHATLDENQVTRWFGDRGERKGHNIGALCGEGYLCLDVDPKNSGLDSFEELIRDHEKLPDTWVEETGEDKEGNRGLHYWFLLPTGLRLKSRKPLPQYPGVDLLSLGSYAIVAPSLHHSGVRYDSVTSPEEVLEAPKWLLELSAAEEEEDIVIGGKSLAEPTGIRPGPDVRKFLRKGGIPEGGQRAMACKAARALWGIWVEVEDASDLIFEALKKCEWGEEPWTENQVIRLVADEYAKQPKALDSPLGVPLPTDLGRAYRLRSFARGNLAFSEETNNWYTWDSTAWRKNGAAAPRAMVHSMAMQEYQASMLAEGTEATNIRKEALKIQSSSTVRNILTEAAVLQGILTEDQQFDKEKMLLNCTNCVIDLRTGESRDQRREDYMTRTTNFAYYPDAESELWEQIVHEACGGDESLVDFLQVAFGYAASGDTREDTFFYLHGPGGTGKTTILEAVAHALGGYSSSADPETFMLSQLSLGLSHRADLAALRHARLVTSTEITQGSKFSPSILNRLTGRDTIAARVPYARAPLVFKPQWTLFFAANHFPSVPGATRRDGFWRRVKILPFENTIARRKMNPALGYQLSHEEHGQAILRWVVDGARRWWENYASKGTMMAVPESVTEQVEEMQEQEDPLGEFVATLSFKKGAVTTKEDMHGCYLGWCDKVGIRMPMGPRKFVPLLRSSFENHSVQEKMMRVGGKDQRCWVGVELPITLTKSTH